MGVPNPGRAPVEVMPCAQVLQQRWSVQAEGGAQIITDSANYCLDLIGGDTTNGAPVAVWECNGSPNQQWRFAGGSFQIQYYADQSKCVDAGDMKLHRKLQIWDCNDLPQQHWGYDADPAQKTIYLSDSSRRLRELALSPKPADFAV